MNTKLLISVIVLIGSLSIFTSAVYALPGNGNGIGAGRDSIRSVELVATPNAPSEDARAVLKIYYNPPNQTDDLIQFVIDATRLECRGPTSSIIERDTAPFEVYLLKVNGEPIVTFNTRCLFGGGAEATGEFKTDIMIRGYDSLIGWLDNPTTDPIHAEIYLESPKAEPPASTLILEGWLY